MLEVGAMFMEQGNPTKLVVGCWGEVFEVLRGWHGLCRVSGSLCWTGTKIIGLRLREREKILDGDEFGFHVGIGREMGYFQLALCGDGASAALVGDFGGSSPSE
jgi:hypothetical protein